MSTRCIAGIALLLTGSAAYAQAEHDHSQHSRHVVPETQSTEESRHVPPDPPSHTMEPMSNAEMVEIMGMDDAARFGATAIDRLEWRNGNDALAWEAKAWYGGDYNKFALKTEGERVHNETEHARTEALWEHTIARWWSTQAGVRYDSGKGPSRTWAAFGIEGLAPYWFDVEATVYVGEQGRTALRAEGKYDLRFTQRLILQPQLEVNLYGKDDPERGLGSGLSDLEAGLRLRYEIRREFAPYIGVQWTRRFGETADLAEVRGDDTGDVQFVAGARVWF